MTKNIGIFYFSGTANTEIVASLLEKELKALGSEVDLIRVEDVLRSKIKVDFKKYDILGIGFPVHAFNAPRIIFDFIKLLPRINNGKKAFVFKTAGGSSFLNDAAGLRTKNKLQKIKYEVFHESLVVMPSNWLKGFDELMQKKLCQEAIKETKKIASEIFEEKEIIKKPGILARISSFIFKIESFGAHFVAKDFYVLKSCNNCGVCVDNCPMENIYRKRGRIKFGWKCVLCMRCLYSCPKKSIVPIFYKFMVIKEGYDIKKVFNEVSKENENQL